MNADTDKKPGVPLPTLLDEQIKKLERKFARRKRAERARWKRLLATRVLQFSVLTLIAVSPIVWLAVGAHRGFLVPVLACVLLNGLVFGISHTTDSSGWYAAAIFLSVPVLGATVAITRTQHTPKVQPVAVIRKGDDVALCGIYVADSGTRLYIGELYAAPATRNQLAVPPNIFSIPDSDVDMVKVGRLEGRKQATNDSRLLASQIYADRAEQAPEIITPTTTVTTTAKGATGDMGVVTSESPSGVQHPTLKAHPPHGQLCATQGGPNRTVPYDP